MNGSMLKTIAKKRPVILFTALVGLLGLTYLTTNTIKESNRLSTLNTGMHTCFTRVQQSFTARMLGDLKGQYLTSEFAQNTERCFGEASKIISEEFSDKLEASARTLNSLSKDIHWFHERISPESEAFSKSSAGVMISNIGGRFEKLENTFNQISDQISLHQKKTSHALQSFYTAIAVIGASLLMLFGWELKELRSKRRENDLLEEEARSLLDKSDMSAMRVKEVLKRGLENNDLYHCSDLFSQFHFYKTQVGSEVIFAKTAQAMAVPNTTNTGSLATQDEFDRIWEMADSDASHLVVYDDMFAGQVETIKQKFDRAPQGTVSTHLDEIVSGIIDHQAQKFFTKGFQVELNVDENHHVYSRAEDLSQIIYSAVNFMTSGHTTSLALNSRKLGNAIIFEIEVTGQGFEDHLIKKQIGFVQNLEDLPTELKICKELCLDVSAKMSYDNLYDDVGNTVGRLFRLTFREAPAKEESSLPNKKVLQVTKGSKKEILARMNS